MRITAAVFMTIFAHSLTGFASSFLGNECQLNQQAESKLTKSINQFKSLNVEPNTTHKVVTKINGKTTTVIIEKEKSEERIRIVQSILDQLKLESNSCQLMALNSLLDIIGSERNYSEINTARLALGSENGVLPDNHSEVAIELIKQIHIVESKANTSPLIDMFPVGLISTNDYYKNGFKIPLKNAIAEATFPLFLDLKSDANTDEEKVYFTMPAFTVSNIEKSSLKDGDTEITIVIKSNDITRDLQAWTKSNGVLKKESKGIFKTLTVTGLTILRNTAINEKQQKVTSIQSDENSVFTFKITGQESEIDWILNKDFDLSFVIDATQLAISTKPGLLTEIRSEALSSIYTK